MPPSRLVFGTRSSALARWQTGRVIERLRASWPDLVCETRLFTTSGDRRPDMPLTAMSGKGVFTEELEDALRSGGIDVAVHSLKDLPIEDSPDLALGAICERDDARDVLVSRERWTLATLPRGARLGTCSLRRSAQVLAARPDLSLLPLRGNVDTRIRKALDGAYDAIVVAAAGVLRLGLGEHIAETLPFDVVLPAPGQAALAVQCRAADLDVLNLLAHLDHAPTRAAVTAERSFLAALGGGCSAPVAAYASHSSPAEARSGVEEGLRLTGLVASADGRQRVRVSGHGADPVALGQALAQQALAQGAGEILEQQR